VDREERLREKPEVERALHSLAEGDRYRLQWGRDEHAGRKIHFWYRNGLGSDDHIELDVNFLHRVPLVPAVERDGWTPDPDFPCTAMLAGTEEILAGKILALLDRGAPRDLYDVAGMAGGRFPYDAHLFRPLFLAFSGVLDRSVTTYVVPHRRTLSQAELDEQLIPVLRGGERPNQAALTASITPLDLRPRDALGRGAGVRRADPVGRVSSGAGHQESPSAPRADSPSPRPSLEG
jgi:hypothetical protein